MTNEFLSQDEVDALLRGVSGESDAPKRQEPVAGIRPYDIGTQERIVRGRMPTLEIINERFARSLRIGLFNFMRRTAEITVTPVKVQKYSDFIRNLIVPTNLNMVQVKPLRGTSLFIFDPKLVFLVVDNMFGGDGRFATRIEGRDFTQTEQRIIHRMLDVVFTDYEKAWKPIYQVKFEYMRSEINTQFANIATPNEVVVTTTFNIEFGSTGGEFHVCMPYAMLEPIRDLLYSSLQGDHMEVDKRWLRLMSKQVQAAEIEIIVNLGHTTATLRELLKLQKGDVLPLDVPPVVQAEVDGVPVMECRYGVSAGQYALKVERIVGNADKIIAECGEKNG